MTREGEVKFDHSQLSGLIESVCTYKEFARLVRISQSRLERLLCGREQFRQSEIQRISKLLWLSGSEINAYFFTPKVQKN